MFVYFAPSTDHVNTFAVLHAVYPVQTSNTTWKIVTRIWSGELILERWTLYKRFLVKNKIYCHQHLILYLSDRCLVYAIEGLGLSSLGFL